MDEKRLTREEIDQRNQLPLETRKQGRRPTGATIHGLPGNLQAEVQIYPHTTAKGKRRQYLSQTNHRQPKQYLRLDIHSYIKTKKNSSSLLANSKLLIEQSPRLSLQYSFGCLSLKMILFLRS